MRLKLPVLLFALIAFVIACKKEENFSSRITFVNAAISNPSFTLKVDSQSVFTGIRYDSLTNSVVPSGTFGLTFFANNVAQTPFITNLESGQPYIGMAYEDSNNAGGLFLRKDALPGTPGDGQCSIRIFNAIARTPAAGLYLANDTAKQRRVLGSLSFANFSSGFTTIDTITNASIRIDSPKVVTRLPGPLLPGKIYTLYLVGRLSDTITGTRKPKVIVQVHN